MLRKLRQLVRQRGRTAAEIEPPKFKIIEGPRRGGIGYAIAVLIALAVGYWLFASRSAQNQLGVTSSSPQPTVPAAPTAPVDREKTGGDALTNCCEWVRPSARSDGTGVDGYWRSKDGCLEACPLATKTIESTPSPKPPVYVGPRGGRYHYSKNGNKVYEQHK